MTANDAGTKTLTIAASNSGAGTGAISVDADGTLTMDSDGALTMGGSSVDVDADGGTLSLDGSTGLNIGTARRRSRSTWMLLRWTSTRVVP